MDDAKLGSTNEVLVVVRTSEDAKWPEGGFGTIAEIRWFACSTVPSQHCLLQQECTFVDSGECDRTSDPLHHTTGAGSAFASSPGGAIARLNEEWYPRV